MVPTLFFTWPVKTVASPISQNDTSLPLIRTMRMTSTSDSTAEGYVWSLLTHGEGERHLDYSWWNVETIPLETTGPVARWENGGYSPPRGSGPCYRFSSQTVISSCSKLALYAASMLSNSASKSSKAQRSAVSDDKLSGNDVEKR